MKQVIKIMIICILVAVAAACCYQIWQIFDNYAKEDSVHQEVLKYKPRGSAGKYALPDNNIKKLQNVNPDVAGWITIPKTKINYPFVLGKDNSFYLSHDIHKQYAFAGTLFMDYRCNNNFSNLNTILYGHNMKNGSMFGELNKFGDRSFFNKNRTGKIYLLNKSFDIEIFAYLSISKDDKVIYNVEKNEAYLEYVNQHAVFYRKTQVSATDRFVTLSTCTNDTTLRAVLIAKFK